MRITTAGMGGERVINRLKAAVKNESGVSILFVLGIMMMLLAVGASVMAAAFGNVGIGIRQERHNRAMLLTDSIHRNIMYSLVDDADFDNSLSGQLAMYIIENAGALDDYRLLDVTIPGVAIDSDVTLHFAYNIGTPVYFTDPATSDITRMVQMSATIRVEVEVEVGGGERSIISRAYYEYFGSLSGTDEDTMEFTPESRVGWTPLSFQIISG